MVRSGIFGRVVAVLLLLLLTTAVLFMLALGHEADGVGRWLSWLLASVLLLTTILLAVGFLAAGVRLTLRISGDRLELCRRGQDDDDVVGRQDIGLVVLHEGWWEGVAAVEILAADESRLGWWDTDWIVKPAPLVMRALKRHGYPYAVGRALYGDRLFWRRGADPTRIPLDQHPVASHIAVAGQPGGAAHSKSLLDRLVASKWVRAGAGAVVVVVPAAATLFG